MKGVFFALLTITATASPTWYRYPAISPDGSQIVFTHGGDLFLVPSQGGAARQLTNHLARDYHPVWAPDGKSIAFASNRYGNDDVFQISVDGGEETRLTYYSKHDVPSAFTPDGQHVIFESVRQDPVASLDIPNKRLSELYQVPANGGRVTRIFSVPAEKVSWSPDGKRFLYHDRKGYEDPWRKHHQSSITRDIWLYDPAVKIHQKITDSPSEDRNPVWTETNSFIFLSERSGSFNVWHWDIAKGGPKQLTFFKNHPVRFLSSSQDGKLAFSYHGTLHVLDPGKNEPQPLKITIRRSRKTNPELVNHAKNITEMAVSPDGKEVAYISRGEIFITSVDHGITRRITETAEQERSVDFHPDGRKLVYASERDDSWNLYTCKIARDGESHFYKSTVLDEEVLLKTDRETFQPMWSPDGKHVAFLQDRVQLRVLDVITGQAVTLLDGSRSYSYKDGDLPYSWSPDGKNILFMLLQKERWAENIVMVPTDGNGEIIDLSRNGYYDMAPQWGWDGEAVLWISNRHGRKAHGSWGYDLDVYAGFLTERAHRYFRFSEDELEEFETPDKDKEKEEKDEEKDDSLFKGEPKKWNPEHSHHRTERLTIHSTELDAYAISPNGKELYYLTKSKSSHELWVHKFYEDETKILTKLGKVGDRDPAEMILSEDGKTLFILSGGSISTIKTADGKKEALKTTGRMTLDPAAERRQMFEHVWRQVREKFHREDFHGTDWDFYRTEYEKLLTSIDNNDDFAEMLSEMLGELDASHTGAFHRPKMADADSTASLGVIYDLSFDGPGIGIREVLPLSPLDLLEDEISPGTLIEAINGEEIKKGENFFARLNRLTGKRTLLSLRDPAADKRWEVVIKPISLGQEMELLYQRWLKRMREKTEELSGGKIGWVHIRGMNDGAFREFFSRVFGHHSDKEGLIVDTRFNGGGWLTEDLTTFLSGKQFLKFYPRGQGNMGGEPIFRWSKPSAVIMGEGNYSDAHLFPYAYKALDIGKLIGMPVPGTGTAVWWERLIDSSVIFGIPQVSTIDTEGRYLENTQLEPDIRVTNSPEDRESGQDRQLEAAVKHLLSLPSPKQWPLPDAE